LTKRSLTTS